MLLVPALDLQVVAKTKAGSSSGFCRDKNHLLEKHCWSLLPPVAVVAKNDASCSKILLRLQQNIVVVVARSELRLMDVAKSFAGGSKIQLWLQLPPCCAVPLKLSMSMVEAFLNGR